MAAAAAADPCRRAFPATWPATPATPLSSPFQSLSRRSDGVGDEAQTLPVRDPKAARSRRVTDISSSFPFNEELRQLSSNRQGLRRGV